MSFNLSGITSTLHQKANEIRLQTVNWKSYLNGLMISNEEYEFISHVEAMNASEREHYFDEQRNRLEAAKQFLGLLGHISKEQIVQYILIKIDDLLNEKKSRVEMFKEYAARRKVSVWSPFFALLNRNDDFIQNMTARILAKLACWSSEQMQGDDLTHYLLWLRNNLKPSGNEYIQNTARCLQIMLRIEHYRHAFVAIDGLRNLIQVLSAKSNFQVQYQLTFCIWIITFQINAELVEKLSKLNLIPILADILSESVKEKVTRIVLATFRNLIEKPDESDLVKDNAITMVHCKVPKQLEILQQSGSKYEDEDLKDDIEYLREKLHTYVLDLSSFDEYTNELKSGRLEWSPVHSSEKFWRENAHRLNEKSYELLKILGGKQLVMQLLTHQEPHVKYEALLCLQKLMVQNWEYLGKKLENEANLAKDGKSSASARA